MNFTFLALSALSVVYAIEAYVDRRRWTARGFALLGGVLAIGAVLGVGA